MTHWTRRLLFGAVAVLVPVLAGCEAGLNAPTLQYHPAANGVTAQHNGVSISNLFVLGPPLNATLPSGSRAGAFLALESTNGDQLTSITTPAAASVKLAKTPVTLPAGTLVDLSGPLPSIVLTGLTGPLSSGSTIQLTLSFAKAGQVTLQVPVEPRAYDFTTFSPPVVPTPTPTASGSASASASPSSTP